MITNDEINRYALQIADPNWTVDNTNMQIMVGHLDYADQKAIAKRAALLAIKTGLACMKSANELDRQYDILPTDLKMRNANDMPF